MADSILRWLPPNKRFITMSPTALPFMPTLFRFSLSDFVLISVFGRIENIYRKFQEQCPLNDGRHVYV